MLAAKSRKRSEKPLLFLMNHSDDPNCAVKMFELEYVDEKERHVWVASLTTLREVSDGEDLTFNYNATRDDNNVSVQTASASVQVL